MTAELLATSCQAAADLGSDDVEVRDGLAGGAGVARQAWRSRTVCDRLWAHERAMFDELRRVVRPGGWLAGRRCTSRPAPPDVVVGEPVDTFAGADGETDIRTFEVFGFALLAGRPCQEAGPGHAARRCVGDVARR